jgi:ABC-2 type transport system permease protein
MSFFLGATWALTRREVIRFFRQRSRVIGTLATPILFWFLIGGGLKSSFVDPSQPMGNYFQYFFPGTIVLSVLFTAIFSTISVIEDRNQGFLQGVLVTPVPRSAIVLSKVLGGAILGVIQGGLLLTLSPLAMSEISVGQILLSLSLLFLMAASLTGLGFYFAWKINSVQGYHGIMNMVLVPLWLLSGAVFPIAGAHFILKYVGLANPLTYAVSSFREILNANMVLSHFINASLLMFLCAFLFLMLNTRMVRRSSFKS